MYKPITKILLITFILGIILFGSSSLYLYAKYGDFSFFEFTDESVQIADNEIRENTLSIGEFSGINIQVASEDIIIQEGADWEISYRINKNSTLKRCEVAEDGTLEIKTETPLKINFWNSISLTTKNSYFLITVPSGTPYGDITITTISGDVELERLYAEELRITSVSGDIEIEELEVESLEIVTTSGEVDIDAVQTETAEMRTTSGDIEIDGTFKELKLSSTSGDFSVDGLFTMGLFRVTSGDTELEGVFQEIEFSSISGDISVDGILGGGTIQTTSGDVEVDTEEPLLVAATSRSGKIRLNNSKYSSTIQPEAGTPYLSVETTSGDIEITTP